MRAGRSQAALEMIGRKSLSPRSMQKRGLICFSKASLVVIEEVAHVMVIHNIGIHSV